MINFTQAFDSAWERMMIILFRPPDAAKWFVIGFNAFLAMLAEGGVVINNSFPIRNQSYTYHYQSLPEFLHEVKQLSSEAATFLSSSWTLLYAGLAILYLCVWLVLNWVGCRGQFILLDNIVRNRAAIAWPWSRYARQGNIWFGFHLGLILFSFFFFTLAFGSFLLLNWAWINAERDPTENEGLYLVMWSLVFVALLIIYKAISFLIRSFVLPLYFKQTMGLGKALMMIARLTVSHPISIILYVLISFILGIAAAVLTILIFCAGCCVLIWATCLPCLGSMLLMVVLCQLILPILIFCRCFQLDCLAQFGPEYNVWTVDVVPAAIEGST